MSKYNIEFFQNFATKKVGLCLSSEYKNVRTKLLWQCKYGHEWMAQPRKILEGSWCPKCHENNRRKYICDDDFFSRDTEETFYVAGFLAADGWKSRSSGGYSVALKLAAKDYEHLITIHDLMGSNSKYFYSEGKSPTTDTITYAYSFKINSKQMFKDLERFGIVERKTYILYIPEWLKNHHLLHHFLRGYVDGDGCFGFAQNKNQNSHVNFSMRGTVNFLRSFNDILVRENVVTHDHTIEARDGTKYLAFDKLQYGGNGVLSKIYDYLYKDAKFYLKRKHEIAAKSKELAVYGTGKRRKIKRTASISKEQLLKAAKNCKNQVEIAKYFNCTPANISWLIKDFNIRNDIDRILNKSKVTKEQVLLLYKDLGTKTAVAKHVGLTKSRIGQIINS